MNGEQQAEAPVLQATCTAARLTQPLAAALHGARAQAGGPGAGLYSGSQPSPVNHLLPLPPSSMMQAGGPGAGLFAGAHPRPPHAARLGHHRRVCLRRPLCADVSSRAVGVGARTSMQLHLLMRCAVLRCPLDTPTSTLALSLPICSACKPSASPSGPPQLSMCCPTTAQTPKLTHSRLRRVQAIGISIWASSQASGTPDQGQIRLGCGITLGGLAIQLLCFVLFTVLTAWVQRHPK